MSYVLFWFLVVVFEFEKKSTVFERFFKGVGSIR